MVLWWADDNDHVSAVKVVCKGDCDRDHGGPSYQLTQLAGPDAAWDAAEELLRGYSWPAALRRKLLAVLRDASRLEPAAPKTGRTRGGAKKRERR